jgi:hypothetical protein
MIQISGIKAKFLSIFFHQWKLEVSYVVARKHAMQDSQALSLSATI